MELDGAMFDAVELAATRRWTVVEELLAQLLEQARAHHHSYVAVHSKRGAKLPPLVLVPRPGDETAAPTTARLGAGAFAAAFGPSRRKGR